MVLTAVGPKRRADHHGARQDQAIALLRCPHPSLRLVEVHPRPPGNIVKRGQLLVEIDPQREAAKVNAIRPNSRN